MKINIICISKKASDYDQKILEYEKRLTRFVNIEQVRISHLSFYEGDRRREEESKKIEERIENDDYVVLLDEEGSEVDSLGFADLIDNRMNDSVKRMVFVIGGAYGTDQSIRNRANYTMRMGKMVWPHELARLMLFEQIYRAYTILNNVPYHNE
ncbi:MAG: rRNA (pseudouridine1915-N3)-methyltransferase [Patescibacteria group bacterium]|nr:rRNA (pseudouridine1915-N3)-methyltransferase [Patescibacteria group bacterium]